MINDLKFPKYFSIQNISVGNASCALCSYKNLKHLFPSKVMPDNLYKKIIWRFKQRKYFPGLEWQKKRSLGYD
jgi:hypothetical protein